MHYFSDLLKVLYMFQTGSQSIIRINSTPSASVVLTTLADANRTHMTNTYCMYTVLR